MAHGTPTLATGKICYLEIPAADVERSSRFYRDAFGWELRTRGDGAIAFDDAVKEVSGSWVTGRPPSAEPGIMVHIMVADLEAALAAVRAAGGEVLNEDAAPGERVGHVRDPAGNVIGIYQQPGLAERERTVRPVPEHLHTVTPRLALSDGAAGIDFYKAAFDAKELGERYHMPDGTLVHAELLIGDSVVMVKDAQDDEFNALLCTYWPDVDAAWDRAVRAGAEVIYPLADQFYGERGGRLGDPFGNQWMLAARIESAHAGRARRAGAGVTAGWAGPPGYACEATRASVEARTAARTVGWKRSRPMRAATPASSSLSWIGVFMRATRSAIPSRCQARR